MPPLTRSRSRPSRRRARRRPLLLALLPPLLLVLALVAVPLAVRLTHDGEALPGTTVAGIDVGGLDAAALRARLRPLTDPREPVVVLAGGRRLTVRPTQAGYRVDLDATVRDALDAGRGGLLGGLPSALAGLVASRHVEPVAAVDPELLRRSAERLAGQVGSRSFPGALRISADLDVSAVPPRAGREVDGEQLRAGLRAALLERSRGPVRVALRAAPVVPAAVVETVANEASDYLTLPLTLTGAGAPVAVSPRELARVIALEPFDGGRRVRLGVDREALDRLVAGIARARDRAPRDARVATAAASGVVVDGKGDLAWRPRRVRVRIAPARAGREIEREALARTIARTVSAGRHRARIAVRRVRPHVTTSAARAASRLIGTFTTYYEPGQPRVRNIRTMARAVDGTVVAPGDRFSLNAITGERTRAKGYVPAPFIADGRLVPSVGGGVSQFATTTYNAAFFAGLQLDSSQPHSLYIERYPAGREATLNYPDIDLVWTNDTRAPVLVRAVADTDSVTVRLYGDNGGRSVRAIAGPRRATADGGFSIEVTRVVRYRGGRVERSSRTTTYSPLEE